MNSFTMCRGLTLRVVALGVLLFTSFDRSVALGRDSIVIDAEVNSKAIHLMFDTGTSGSALYSTAAKRLGITILPPSLQKSNASEEIIGVTEPLSITIFGKPLTGIFTILELPEIIDWEADGILSWGDIQPNIIQIDSSKRKLIFLENLPTDTLRWQRLPIRKHEKVLIIETNLKSDRSSTVFVDVGAEDYVRLSTKNWEQWKSAHPSDPVTLMAGYMPGAGIVVSEVMWAKNLDIGPFHLTNVKIREANVVETANGGGKDFEMSLSMEGLKGLDFIVDGIGGFVYWSPKDDFKGQPPLNRSGMIVAPRDPQSDDLIAHVVKGSPADEAGIQTGDVIVKINSQDVSNWRSGKAIKFAPLAEQLAGTKIEMILRRGTKEFETIITLRDIF